MLKNNLFYLNKIKNVVFLGACNVFDELIKINKNINLNSFIVSSPDQLKNIKTNFKIKTFQKLDKKFKSYIKEQINIDETLFVSLGSRWIFNKKIITDFFKSFVRSPLAGGLDLEFSASFKSFSPPLTLS